MSKDTINPKRWILTQEQIDAYKNWLLDRNHVFRVYADDYEAWIIEAMEAYAAQFSQQPTEKTREEAIKFILDFAHKWVNDENSPSGVYTQHLVDALIQHGYIQSDSVDAKELYVADVVLDKWIGEMYLEFKAGESGATMAANLGEKIEKYFAGSKVKPVNDGWIDAEIAIPLKSDVYETDLGKIWFNNYDRSWGTCANPDRPVKKWRKV